MLKKAILSSVLLVPLFASTALAISNQDGEPPAPKKRICKLALAQAQNPDAEKKEIVGTVYGVVGNIVMVEVEGGGIQHVYLTYPERSAMGQLRGQKVIITDIRCNRIRMAPPPAPVPGQAIEVPKIDVTPTETPTLPPPSPRPPVEQPEPAPQPTVEPAPEPTIIPQTW
ncbi:MAG: hypothetical protein VKL59_11140 [Nostocaceae cyanobacterium]|nr:hypothetical protein [Nostocaceae cyanobacterium]